MGRSQARRELMANELLERAAALFAERGFKGTTLQEIADDMGVSRPALYHYISSKEDLLSQLVQGITRQTAAAMREIRQDLALSPDEKLQEAILDMARRIGANPARFRLLDRSEHHLNDKDAAEHQAAKRQVLEDLRAIISEGVRAGSFRPLDETAMAFAILGMCNWLAWWFRLDKGAMDVETVAQQLSELALNGLRSDRRMESASVEGAVRRLRDDLALLERSLSNERESKRDGEERGVPDQ